MALPEPPRRRRVLAALRLLFGHDQQTPCGPVCPGPQLNRGGQMKAIILLVISNTFMTLAWYGHLRFKEKPLWLMILASWGIAFFEYLFQVPANGLGSYQFSVTRRNRNGGPLHY